jgi:hypothetical protein
MVLEEREAALVTAVLVDSSYCFLCHIVKVETAFVSAALPLKEAH